MGEKRCCWLSSLFQLGFAIASVQGAHPGENDVCDGIDAFPSGSAGFLESPVDPETGKYPANAFCIWEFDVPEDKYVILRFTRLDVELSNGCDNDRVEIYDAKESYDTFCGSGNGTNGLPPPIVLAAKDRVFVNLVTDDLLQFGGFQIEYTVTDKPNGECEGFLCRNRRCVSKTAKCDGQENCGDASDEDNCHEGTTDEKESLPEPDGTCGIRTPSRLDTRVVGGQAVTSRGAWPWMVSLQKSYIFNNGHFCGGALINRRWVVTAAHCLNGVVKAQQKVILGRHHRYQSDQGEVERYPTVNCIHPGYHKAPSQDDIALVKLNAPVNYSEFIRPICLPSNDSLPQSCIVTGWGRTQGSGGHDALKQVEVPLLSKEDCDLQNEFCLLDQRGRHSPCYGDSGGPVVQQTSDRWRLYGLISRGAEICGFRNDPTICTQVSAFVGWIKDQLKNEAKGLPLDCLDTRIV